MFFKKDKKKIPQASKELAKYVEGLEKQIQELSGQVKALKQEMKKAITKVGVLRFNPFKETGSDQSFAIALLDENNDGFVLTSHYLKEYNRVYAKPVKSGKSEYSLSKEEEEAIVKAITNSKEQIANHK